MPTFDEELMGLGGRGPSFEDELAGLGGGMPQVGVTLEGLDAEAEARELGAFKPYGGPADRPASGVAGPRLTDAQIPNVDMLSAGAPVWGERQDRPDGLEGLSPEAFGSLSDAATGLKDGAYAAAGGMFSGLGINPDRFGPDVQASLDMGRERSPIAAPVGQVAGEIGSQAAATSLVPGAGAYLGARPGLSGGVSGALSAVGNSDAPNVETALEGFGGGVVYGKAGELLGRAAGGVADWGGDLVKRGLRNTVASSGAYGGDLRRMADNMGGREGLEELGQWMRDKNVAGPFRSAEEVGNAAQDVVSSARGERTQFLDDLAGQPPIPVHTQPIIDDLRQFGGTQQRLAPQSAKAKGSYALQEADNLETAAGGAPTMPFQEALDNRIAFDEAVPRNKIGGPREDTYAEEIERRVADGPPGQGGGLRGALVDALDAHDPAMSQQFQQFQGDIHHGLAITKPAAQREFKELGNQTISLPTLLAAGGAGGAIGGGAQALSGDDPSLSGVAGGIAAGAGMALLKNRGKSAIAAGQVNTGRATQFIGDMVGDALKSPGAARAGGAVAGNAVAAQSRGYLLPEAVTAALQEGGAELGPYAQQFAQAKGSDDTGAVGQLITKLSQTDQKFRTEVLPKLRYRTGGGAY